MNQSAPVPISDDKYEESWDQINLKYIFPENIAPKMRHFKKIEVKDEEINNQIDINIEVEEKSTGEFQVGLGVDSYEGATFITGLKEKNIFGEGRELNLNVNTSSTNTIYSFGVVEPHIFNREIDLIYDISATQGTRSYVITKAE